MRWKQEKTGCRSGGTVCQGRVKKLQISWFGELDDLDIKSLFCQAIINKGDGGQGKPRVEGYCS